MSTATHHRADVQGLRALAVVVVVAFHAGLPLSGGFVGVDVFFVISGFVITRMLIAEIDRSGQLDFRRFYARRLHRLAPPLALLIVVAMPFFVVVSDPMDAQILGARTAAAASMFLANAYLLFTGGNYFGPTGESNPFLHTWSLSVEEQFYIVMPLLLVLAWRATHRWARVAAIIGACCVASFVVAVVAVELAHIERPPAWLLNPGRFAFYFVVPRFWELGAGVVLALVAHERHFSLVVRTVLSIAGTTLLTFAVVTFDKTSGVPGAAALVVVAATVALLLARVPLLGAAPLSWIGDRSYSWYLWHWPAIVIAREVWPASTVALPVAAIVALVPACISFHVVENPLRRSARTDVRRLATLVMLCVALPACVGLAVARGARYRWGLQHPPQWSMLSVARQNGCIGASELAFAGGACLVTVTGARGVIALIGDSHAASASDAVVAAAQELGYDVAMWQASNTPFVGAGAISPLQQQAWRFFIETIHPVAVVTASDTTANMQPGSLRTPAGHPTRDRDEALAAWSAGFEDSARFLDDRHIALVWFHDGPNLLAVPKVTLLHPVPEAAVVPTAVVMKGRADIVAAERAVAARHDNVTLFDPLPSLCGETCPAVVDGDWLYSDTHHLTPAGSMRLRERLTATLKAALP